MHNLPIKIVGNKITVDFLAKETHFSVILNESSDDSKASRGQTEIWVTVGDPSKESATIRKSASLTGQVVNQKNEPVSGVTIKASSRPSTPSISECTVTFDIERQSGSDGKFEFPDIASGSVSLWILSEKVALPDRLAALTLNAGDNAEQTLIVKPACQISGRVVDTAGKPVPGVKLSIGKVVFTDAEGKYSGYANSSHVFANILEMPPGYLGPFDSQVGAKSNQI